MEFSSTVILQRFCTLANVSLQRIQLDHLIELNWIRHVNSVHGDGHLCQTAWLITKRIKGYAYECCESKINS